MYISVLQYSKLSECNDVIIDIHLTNLSHKNFCPLGSCELVNGDNEENGYHHGEFNNHICNCQKIRYIFRILNVTRIKYKQKYN